MKATKTDVNGKIMWETPDKERLRSPWERPKDLYGWHKVTVEGRTMWESPEGERVFYLPGPTDLIE